MGWDKIFTSFLLLASSFGSSTAYIKISTSKSSQKKLKSDSHWMNREIRSDDASMSDDVLLTSFEMVANYPPHLECVDEKNLIKHLIIHYVDLVTEKKKKKIWQEYCTWDGIKRGTKSIIKSIIQLMSGNCASTHAHQNPVRFDLFLLLSGIKI